MNAHDKARLLGLLFWIYTIFNIVLVGAIAVIYIGLFGFIFTQVPQKAGDPPPELIMTILIVAFVFALLFTILFSVPKMVAGYGLRKEKSWAWTWSLIASIMACMSFPFGTVIGVFGLVFLLVTKENFISTILPIEASYRVAAQLLRRHPTVGSEDGRPPGLRISLSR